MMDIMIQDTNHAESSIELESIIDTSILQHMLEQSEDLEYRRLIRARMRSLKKEKQLDEPKKPLASSATRASIPEQKFLPQHNEDTINSTQSVSNLRKTSHVPPTSSFHSPLPEGELVSPKFDAVRLKSPAICRNNDDKNSGLKLEELKLRSVPRDAAIATTDRCKNGAFLCDVALKHVVPGGDKTSVAVNVNRSKANPTARQALKHFQQMDNESLLRNSSGTKDPLESIKRSSRILSPNNIRDQTLFWCKNRLYGYENVSVDDFSTSWNDGLAFCALANSYFPHSFDYDSLTSKDRRHNFQLAFDTLEKEADIVPLLEVDDMVASRIPDWKCVFTYVNSIIARMAEIRKDKK